MAQKLKADGHGNAIMMPVTGWQIGPAADIAVFLSLEHIASLDQFETPDNTQVVLTPQQALQLAEALTRHAKRILEPPPGKTQ